MSVAIVKYNAGNIYSVVHALRRLGVEPVITDDAGELARADKILFPGQGEASHVMSYLRGHGLDEVIRSLRQPVLGICIGQQLLCRHTAEGDVDCLGVFDTEVEKFAPSRHEDKVPHMGWNSIYNQKTLIINSLENKKPNSLTANYYGNEENITQSANNVENKNPNSPTADYYGNEENIIQPANNVENKNPNSPTTNNMGNDNLLTSPLFKGLENGAYVYFVHSYYVPLCPWTIAATDYIVPFSAAMNKDNFYATQFHPEKSGDVGEMILKNFLSL